MAKFGLTEEKKPSILSLKISDICKNKKKQQTCFKIVWLWNRTERLFKQFNIGHWTLFRFWLSSGATLLKACVGLYMLN